jgi:FtsZ-interacting cell division protein ZipA
MIDSISGLLRVVVEFLGGLTILDFIFLGLFLIIYLWMLGTHKRVKRVISDPLKKYDNDIKKKQDELDREKEAIRAFANKEIKKVEGIRAELKAQFEKELEALKGIKIEKEDEPVSEAKARARVKKEIEAEKAMMVEEVEEKVIAEREVQIETAEEVVKEIPVEEEVKAEPALEPEPEAPSEEEIQAEKEPEEEPKKAPEKPAKKEKPSKLTSEQYFILSAIADEPDKTYQEEAMHKIFKMAFSDRTKEDFDQDIKKLEKLNYIVLEKPSGYRVWLKITDKGLNHYRNTERK